ncbi:MAG: AAA family ATPase [Gammaproteobacteria bacterium]|nr:AAA family ATPase [Gammaproteobacteria bacterium]
MYEQYFGLERPPFKITPDTSLFYDGGKRGDILGALVYAVDRGEGIVKVVGEVGSGKTMLCRMLQLKLPSSVEIIYIANPSVSAQDILFVIAHELGLSVNKEASKHEVMHQLQDYLLQRHMEDKQVVLFVEEAQGMPLDTLEEIRLLSNLETDQNKLLQIILFGQPELDENLAQKSIRQLRERITHNFELSPLTPDEIHLYLNFRMREVGYTGPELIDLGLARKIEVYSNGLLRRINIIADKILLSAFAEGTHNLSPKHVVAAVNDSSFGSSAPKGARPSLWITASMLLIAGFSLFYSQHYWLPVIIGQSGIDNPGSKDQNIVRIEAEITENKPQSVEPQSEIMVRNVETGEDVSIPEKTEQPIIESITSNSKPESESVTPEVQDSDSKTELSAVTEPAAIIQTDVADKEQKTLSVVPSTDLTGDDNQWLNGRLLDSRNWLVGADRDSVSIQVMVRRKSATKDLVSYLRNEWPMDLDRTYLFEVKTKNQSMYRVFYSEFSSLANGQSELKRLPESVKVNQPYLQSVYRMQEALL